MREERKQAKRARKAGGASGYPPVKKRDDKCARFRMTLSYQGGGFRGWQKQHPPGKAPLRTVESTLEECLRPVVQQKVRFFACGRTDAGVSAAALVAQFDCVLDDMREPVEADRLAPMFNAALPADVRCLAVDPVAKDFNAMANLWKRYVYHVPGAPAEVLAFCSRVAGLGTFAPARDTNNAGAAADGAAADVGSAELDVAAMRSAAARLVGKHDFAGFQSRGGRATTVRTLYRCDVARDTGGLRVTMEADGFLMHQCRIIAGTLIEVGLGKLSGSLGG